MKVFHLINFRSCCSKVLYGTANLENFKKLTGKHMPWSTKNFVKFSKIAFFEKFPESYLETFKTSMTKLSLKKRQLFLQKGPL